MIFFYLKIIKHILNNKTSVVINKTFNNKVFKKGYLLKLFDKKKNLFI